MSWSITRIKHPKYPEVTVRVGEFVPRGTLHVFRWVNGKQSSRSLKCRRCDLGSNPKVQEKEARRLACEYIEALANPAAVVESPGTKNIDHSGTIVDKSRLTIGDLGDKYKLDGFAKATAAYKRDAVASIRRISAFLEADSLLVRDIKPSHVEKYLASRIAKKHAPAGRADLVARRRAAAAWSSSSHSVGLPCFHCDQRQPQEGFQLMHNSIPKLLNTLRPSLRDIAEWADVSRGLANFWLAGTYQPKAPDRTRLIKAVRKHAALLLVLAEKVEREGQERAAAPPAALTTRRQPNGY